MTKDQKLKRIVELDGGTFFSEDNVNYRTAEGYVNQRCKDYFNSYDAIIPAIRKQPRNTFLRMGEILMKYPWSIKDVIHTPEQLCEALIEASI